MRSPFLKNILTASLLPLLAAGCGGKTPGLPEQEQDALVDSAYEEAAFLVLEDQPVAAAAYLWNFSSGLPPPYHQEVRVRAAEILLDASRPLDAYRYLLQISEDGIANKTLLEKRVAMARFYRQTDQAERIPEVLPLDLVRRGDPPAKITGLELLSDALMLGDQFVHGINLRLEIHKLLDDERRMKNLVSLWRALLYLDPWQVNEQLLNNPDGDARRWLELAALATPLEMDLETLESEYLEWEKKNRRWRLPELVVEELRARWQYFDYRPGKIALLLPLTGSYAKAGAAVKDGFFELYNTATTPDFSVAVHNTDQSTRTEDVYDKALKDGDVDLVIGPLLKPEVDRLTTHGGISVPTISLNYASTNTRVNDKLFQFGLLPENEAQQAAQKIRNDGHEFIAVLSPNGEWGKRLYRAFENQYTALGGTVRALSRYDPGFVDYATVIESLFRIDRSRERHRLIATALGEKPRFTPRIRSDVSAVMLFADHRRAVMIFPQMKFHYVDKLPVYATSHAYRPGAGKVGRDLDRLIYCDIPAIVERKRFTDAEAGEYARLRALGADAYQLVKRYRHMQVSRFVLNGQTGKITVEENQRLFRKLPWARFSRGKPVPYDTL